MSGNTADPLVVGSTLVALLRQRAQEQPAHKLYTFLCDGEEEAALTYAELDHRACALAARLQSSGARGERVLLLYPSGLDYIIAFFGCLYAGAVAIPAYPPRQNRNSMRLQAIIADAQAKFSPKQSFCMVSFYNKQHYKCNTQPYRIKWISNKNGIE